MTYRRIRRAALIAACTLATAVGPAAALIEHEDPASQLRLQLSQALAEHAFLTLEAMRTGIDEGDAFAAAGEALAGNTQDVIGLIEGAYGEDAADAFGDLWRAHIGYVVDYTRALADGDEAGQRRAVDQLVTYSSQLAELLASVNPNLTVAGVRGLLEDHVHQLEQVASFARGNYAEAYPAVRETYAHMFTIGDGLTSAIAHHLTDVFPDTETAFGPAVDLAVTLDRLLGEHALLAVLVTRAGLTDAADRDAALAALDENSAELAAAIRSIYGDDAGDAFGRLWDEHIDQYLAYVEAVQAGDERAMDDAREGLRRYRSEFGALLTDANPELSESALQSMLTAHTNHLLEQVDAFAVEDYEAAYAVTREAYAHMGELAQALAVAISAQFPDRYPDTATPAPGGAGPSASLVIAWGGLAALVVAAAVVRRRLAR